MTHLTRSLCLTGLEKAPIIRWANRWANQKMDAQKSKEYQQVFRFLQEVVRPQSRPSCSSVLQALNFGLFPIFIAYKTRKTLVFRVFHIYLALIHFAVFWLDLTNRILLSRMHFYGKIPKNRPGFLGIL